MKALVLAPGTSGAYAAGVVAGEDIVNALTTRGREGGRRGPKYGSRARQRRHRSRSPQADPYRNDPRCHVGGRHYRVLSRAAAARQVHQIVAVDDAVAAWLFGPPNGFAGTPMSDTPASTTIVP